MKKKFAKVITLATCMMCMTGQVYAAPVASEETTVSASAETAVVETEEISETDIAETSEDTVETAETETDEEDDAIEVEEESETEEDTSSESVETEAAETEETEEDDDMISVVNQENGPDEEGYVSMTVQVADDVTLPVSITMKQKDEETKMSITYQGQQIRIKPGTYKLTSVVDGNGKKLDDGARLTIPEENGNIYLDFNKPDDGKTNLFLEFIKTNFFFIPVAGLVYIVYVYVLKRR